VSICGCGSDLWAKLGSVLKGRLHWFSLTPFYSSVIGVNNRTESTFLPRSQNTFLRHRMFLFVWSFKRKLFGKWNLLPLCFWNFYRGSETFYFGIYFCIWEFLQVKTANNTETAKTLFGKFQHGKYVDISTLDISFPWEVAQHLPEIEEDFTFTFPPTMQRHAKDIRSLILPVDPVLVLRLEISNYSCRQLTLIVSPSNWCRCDAFARVFTFWQRIGYPPKKFRISTRGNHILTLKEISNRNANRTSTGSVSD